MRRVVKSVVLEGYNVNGRVYPREVVENAMKEYRKKIKQRISLGQTYFGPDEFTRDLHLSDVSHLITKVSCRKDGVHVKCKILETPKGIRLSEALGTGRVKFETVGIGRVEKGVVTDLQMLSIDAILIPPPIRKPIIFDEDRPKIVRLYSKRGHEKTVVNYWVLLDELTRKVLDSIEKSDFIRGEAILYFELRGHNNISSS